MSSPSPSSAVSARAVLRRARGFTLMEVMVAVFFGAAILVAATTFVFSMGELWGKGAEERLYQKHARGVTRFLEESFQKAGFRQGSGEGGSTPVYWMERGGGSAAGEELLTFELDASPGPLVWPEEPLPFVVCSLRLDAQDGLLLLWRSRLEEDFREKAPRATLLSPFVTELRYYYIDREVRNPDWEILLGPKRDRENELALPERIELVFNYKGETIERQIVLPAAFQGVPLF